MNDLKIIQVTERLHQVFEALHNCELKDSSDPYQPEVFLQSLRYIIYYHKLRCIGYETERSYQCL